MKTRTGKIARLPRSIRDELNRRLENGQSAQAILPWLNALPEVQAILAAEFDASPVTPQNLSNWRQGGYQQWRFEQERYHLVRGVVQDANEITRDPNGPEFAQKVSTVLLAHLAVHASDAPKTPTTPARQFDQLRQMLHTVSLVRRDDHRSIRLALSRERQQAQAQAQEQEREQRRERERENKVEPSQSRSIKPNQG